MPLAESSRPDAAEHAIWAMAMEGYAYSSIGAKKGNTAFQRMTEWVLKDSNTAWTFVDDVIVASGVEIMDEAIKQHAKDVGAVLGKFGAHHLVYDLSKSQIFHTELEFCGHAIDHGKR